MEEGGGERRERAGNPAGRKGLRGATSCLPPPPPNGDRGRPRRGRRRRHPPPAAVAAPTPDCRLRHPPPSVARGRAGKWASGRARAGMRAAASSASDGGRAAGSVAGRAAGRLRRLRASFAISLYDWAASAQNAPSGTPAILPTKVSCCEGDAAQSALTRATGKAVEQTS